MQRAGKSFDGTISLSDIWPRPSIVRGVDGDKLDEAIQYR